MSNPYSNIDFNSFIGNFAPEFIKHQNERYLDETEEGFRKFTLGLDNDTCYICGKPINDLSGEPCLHWLINEKIKKKNLRHFLNSKSGFFSIYSYMVWCANYDKPFVNINDLKCEIQPNKHFECTIKFRIWEWSISISKSDYIGHPNTQYGKEPHWHLQIKKDGYPFLNFSDTHLKFSKDDLLYFAMMEQGIMSFDPGFGAGLAAIADNDYQQELLDCLQQSSDKSASLFRTRTVISTENLSPEILEEIHEIHKNTNLTYPAIINKLNEEKGYGIEFVTRSFPESYPEMQHRSHRGGSRNEE